MVVADLHVHTTNSDGSMELDEVPTAAARAGVDVVAITDHDRLNPALHTPVTHVDGITLLHGIELRVDAGPFRVDLLGYGAQPTGSLAEAVERLQRNRIERAREITGCVEARLDVSLDVEFTEGVGRPHIARAIDASDADLDYGGAFEELIGNDGPCYVPREVPDFETGVELLAGSCGLVGLAHPFRYDDPEAALELCADLDAVERFYPYGREVDEALLDRYVERYDLVRTGGSDAHDDVLGLAGLDADDYRRFRNAVDLSA
ncbi:PHP domain-containing protein [Salinirubellus salinus]|uniref:PHP domain-containing protein n=1 Tax=Salinirubellus salinus TaxID=1364945 RepID=A0A9E7U9U9_9EURY|nr:PHP domain-containing protein [Salinirubellus salinus]UWM53538.1 PHP domain-containing protein [Salinirubellus salinus]